MSTPSVQPSYYEPYISLTCSCGWDGFDKDVEEWDVQEERDRVVRVCPSCEESMPEWGTLLPIDGAAAIACGSLRESLVEAGVLSDDSK